MMIIAIIARFKLRRRVLRIEKCDPLISLGKMCVATKSGFYFKAG